MDPDWTGPPAGAPAELTDSRVMRGVGAADANSPPNPENVSVQARTVVAIVRVRVVFMVAN
jgi:hypothetical protein